MIHAARNNPNTKAHDIVCGYIAPGDDYRVSGLQYPHPDINCPECLLGLQALHTEMSEHQ